MNAQVLSLTKSGNFIGLLFLLVAFAFACGGSPSASEDKKDVTQAPSSSRLSFGEYLAVCAGPTSGAIDEEITLKEFAEALGEFTERLESVEPPEEVTDWHNAVLVYQRALKMELDDGPEEGESEAEYLLSTALTLALEHQPEISAAIMAMDGDILVRMLEAGCIDEDVLGLTLTEEERNEIPVGNDGGDGGRAITEFSSISAGDNHTCGVGTGGSVACWGDDLFGVSTPPEGEFTSVSAGWAHTCGVRTDGSVACWGGGDDAEETTPPEGQFTSVSAGRGYTCGVRTDGSVTCWGDDGDGESSPPEGEFSSVSAGRNHTCGVRTDGSVICWGNDFLDKATPPEGEFIAVAAAFAHSCGVRTDGSIACWGQDLYGEATPPEGEFVSVSAGDNHTCGVRTDGSIACWGNDGAGQATPPEGEFTSVSAGSYHTCGVRTDASVACWGSNTYGQASPPGAP